MLSYSFIYSCHFILARVVKDADHILVTLGVKMEYTMDGTPVYRRAPCTHTFTHLLINGQETSAWAFYGIWPDSVTYLQSSGCSGRSKGSMIIGRGGKVLYGDKLLLGAHSRDAMPSVHYDPVLQGLLHPEEEPPLHQADVWWLPSGEESEDQRRDSVSLADSQQTKMKHLFFHPHLHFR